MKIKVILLTTIALMAVFMLAANPSAQPAIKVYGYVSVGGVFTNSVNVTLAGLTSGHTVTANDTTGHPGYYEFSVSNGSNYMVTADYQGHSAQRGSVLDVSDVRIDLDISLATPTPTVTPTPTPTPRPSGDLGGLVTRNDSSSFIPVSVQNPSATPLPKSSWAPTATPAAEPTATATAAPGLLSNVYVWLAIALAVILAIAAAILVYLRR